MLEQLIAPASLALASVRGDSIEQRFRVIDKGTGAPLALTGWGGAAAVYDGPGSLIVTVELDTVVAQDAVGQPDAGLIIVSAAAGVTTTAPANGVWALVLTSGDVRKTVVAGEWCMRESVIGGAYRSPGYCAPAGSPNSSCGYSETLGQAIPCGVTPTCACGGQLELSAKTSGELKILVGASC